MHFRSISSPLGSLLPVAKSVFGSAAQRRVASTMAIETSQMNVLHGPLQPLTREGDSTHPTGFFRDGYCWGSELDAGQHYIGAVVTEEFLKFSKSKGNDLSTPRPGFTGLREGCKWCLCVSRWREALFASDRLGEQIVPRVDLSATAFSALRQVELKDLRQFEAPSSS